MTIADLVAAICFIKNADYTRNYCKSIGTKVGNDLCAILDLENSTIHGIQNQPITFDSDILNVVGNLSCNNVKVGDFTLSCKQEDNESHIYVVDENNSTKVEIGTDLVTKQDLNVITSDVDQNSDSIKVLANFLKFIPEIASNEEAIEQLDNIINGD